MAQGTIIKALSGFYYVLPEGGTTHGPDRTESIQCRARGIFKKNKVTPLVGDKVIYEATENGEGTVDEILPRTSELIRPPIANVSLAVLVFSVAEPDLNLQLLDKFLVHIEAAGIEALICLTKKDLDGEDGGDNCVPASILPYQEMGYEVYSTSSRQGWGIDAMRKRLSGTISVFSGQSGVGKSSLLNAMMPDLRLETNEISSRLGRGKHTTRHVELIPLESGGWVADTPGFSQLDFSGLEAQELGGCFRDFTPFAEGCRFRGCLHHQEPGCHVRQAAESGDILPSRYEHYLLFLAEIKDRKRRY
ncbi:ribosome small subunit-dependent GTPase A [Paenibacillus aurantius]|uniref:Small ribosomal subunit biogenesis GTPase RsgA n=1 Tax=Paenibacillus aurantius TaxID=2918900 RepID=A0AA96LGK4_9BACL|nr:ribosome small subunit-dependent GTPase A [Paenibacillus aurantius]WNQ13674.1 ribosome small subunit-dependent GTPase A [Paenibacillus aurantius]